MTYEDVKAIRHNPKATDVDNRKLAKMIDDAVDKQIPKRPIYTGFAKENGEIEFYGWLCPACADFKAQRGSLVGREDSPTKMSYCYRCGQAIDWSEEEGE